ncbi:cytochrome P450 [Lentinus brumalis]|uniref:Cytochrome P450 n=1 Tax=Lentinus brumalis TaxID=2498619 RepID=A0A371D1N4_9APHY|nr:cytochrome P450 [Polyporus brumalis]
MWKARASSQSPLNNIPGPQATSWLKGHMGQLFHRDAYQFRKDISERYGRVVRLLGLFSKPQLFVFDPIALHAILVKEHHIFEEPATHLVGNSIAFGPGLASVIGDQHKKQRKLLNPAFSIAHLRETLPMMYDVAYRLRDAVSARLESDEWTDIDMMGWVSRTALELVAQAGLGSSLDSLEDDHASPYGEALKSFIPALLPIAIFRRVLPFLVKIGSPSFRRRIVDLIPYQPLRKVKSIIDVLDANARRIVSEKIDAVRRGDEAGDGKDILSRLVRANMEASGDEVMSEEEIVGQVSTLVFAATDTTSSAVARILHLLAEHHDVQEKLRREIVQARSDGDLTFDELFELPYLEAVCRETLRLYAPVSFVSKTARQDTVLPLSEPIHGVNGHEIERLHVPKGTNVFVGIYAANRAKDLWGEDAEEWKPERWLTPLPDTLVQARMPGVYSNMMTFLGGGRACIGFKFSQCEMKVVLSILLESFAFKLSETSIRWNTASVHYPSSMTSDKAQLPLKVKRLVRA